MINENLPTPSHVALDAYALACHENAKEKGFYEHDFMIRRLLSTEFPLPPWALLVRERILATHEQNMAIKRHGLIASEVGELTEAVRKPRDAEHIKNPAIPSGSPEFTQEEEEVADILIRVFDYCGYRGLRIGAAVEAKMAFNSRREHMHGKLS